jgi:hypothetical protein
MFRAGAGRNGWARHRADMDLRVGRINDSLDAVIGRPVDLHMRSVLTAEIMRDGIVAPVEVLRPNM